MVRWLVCLRGRFLHWRLQLVCLGRTMSGDLLFCAGTRRLCVGCELRVVLLRRAETVERVLRQRTGLGTLGAAGSAGGRRVCFWMLLVPSSAASAASAARAALVVRQWVVLLTQLLAVS